jgi:PHD/YefM family antitoxin component YafN of YafNO toxin-antitoxin module
MEPVTVGIREFRENLAAYLLESQGPVAITRHGDPIGYYIPARHKRTEAERTARDCLGSALHCEDSAESGLALRNAIVRLRRLCQ